MKTKIKRIEYKTTYDENIIISHQYYNLFFDEEKNIFGSDALFPLFNKGREQYYSFDNELKISESEVNVENKKLRPITKLSWFKYKLNAILRKPF